MPTQNGEKSTRILLGRLCPAASPALRLMNVILLANWVNAFIYFNL